MRRMSKLSCLLLTFTAALNIPVIRGKDEECTQGYKELAVTSEARYLSSPNYPGHYPTDINCRRKFYAASGQRIRVSIISMELEGSSTCYDYVEFFDGEEDDRSLGKECRSTRDVVSSGYIMTMLFSSDGSLSRRGFRLSYRALGEDAVVSVTRPPTCPSRSHHSLTVRNEPFRLTSPHYPSSYADDLSCYWNVEAEDRDKVIRVVVTDIDMENNCNYDSLTIYDGLEMRDGYKLATLCGSNKASVFSTGPAVLLHFQTDGSTSGKGFSLDISEVHKSVAQQQPDYCPPADRSRPITAADEFRELRSPNYPEDYPSNRECFWVIKASTVGYVVEVVVRDSRLEGTCSYDSVKVRDGSRKSSDELGTFCGTDTPTYYSTGEFLSVHFTSDGSSQFKGFLLEYRQLSPDDVPTGPGLEVILPSVFGALAGLLLCFCCCKYCCCDDKETPPSGNGTAAVAGGGGQSDPNRTFTHPPTVVTWTSGGAAAVSGAADSSEDRWKSPSYPGYPSAPAYPAQGSQPYPPPPPQPENPHFAGYSAPGAYPPHSGYRPSSPYHPGAQSGHEGAGASAYPVTPSAPPPPPTQPMPPPGNIEEPPPSYDSLQFDSVTREPLLPRQQAAGGQEEHEEKSPLYLGEEFGRPGER